DIAAAEARRVSADLSSARVLLARADEALSAAYAVGNDLQKLVSQVSIAEGEIARIASKVEQMWAVLHARPYTSDPSKLTVIDERGREALGFDTPSATPEGYLEFEDLFRGREAFIMERQRGYISVLTGHAPVLDVGCGRGEFLDLL